MSKAEADIAFIANRSIATPVVIIRTWLNQLLANCNYYSPRRIFVRRYFFFIPIITLRRSLFVAERDI